MISKLYRWFVSTELGNVLTALQVATLAVLLWFFLTGWEVR